MSDDQFTKIAVSLLTGVKDLVDWGVEGGHTTEEQLRLTVSARQAKAKELVGAGVSQRQAAKLLGVSHTQIRKDVETKLPETENIVATKSEVIRLQNEEVKPRLVEVPDERFETIVIDPPWPMKKIERDVRPS